MLANDTHKRKNVSPQLVLLVSTLSVAILITFKAYNSIDSTVANNREIYGPTRLLENNEAALNTPPTYVPCALPCWHGITPGKSTDQQVQALVQKMPGYERSAYSFNDGSEVDYAWSNGYSTEDRTGHNVITTKSGVAELITLFYEPLEVTTLGDVVGKFGPPEKVMAAFYGVGAGPNIVGFLYPEKGLYFATDYLDVHPIPQKDMPIIEIRYFAPTTWSDYKARFLRGTDSGFEDWTGFRQSK